MVSQDGQPDPRSALPRVAIVTGTSSGMGLHAAVGLAKAGFQVIGTVRRIDRAAALLAAAAAAGTTVEPRELEVTDASSRQALIDGVLASHGRIDLLVNNAGRGIVAPLEELTEADLQAQLDVNYLSVAMLTKLVLPIMRAQSGGRILTVTSVGGVIGQPFADAYCAAKFATEGLMQSLAPVSARFGVEVGVIEPAAVASEFYGSAAHDLADRRRTDSPYAAMLDAYLARTTTSFANAQSAQDAGAAIVTAATAAQWQFRWQTSDIARYVVGQSLADLDGSAVLALTGPWIGQPE